MRFQIVFERFIVTVGATALAYVNYRTIWRTGKNPMEGSLDRIPWKNLPEEFLGESAESLQACPASRYQK